MVSFDSEISELQRQVERQIEGQLQQIDRITDHNQWKVINAFQQRKVSDFHFAGSTGYAYNDRGREVLDEVYADVFGAEAALVRPHFASGTHTISTALFGVLRPGDELLYITGKPYDTLHKVIGKPGDGTGSLRDFGIGYRETALTDEGGVDWTAVEKALHRLQKSLEFNVHVVTTGAPPSVLLRLLTWLRVLKRLREMSSYS